MVNNTKAHDTPNRFPQQIQHTKSDHDIALTIDRAGSAGKSAIVAGQILQANLLAVDAWSPFAPIFELGHWQVRHSVGFGARDQMMPAVQKRRNDLATGVIGIGHQHHGSVPDACYRKQQRYELVEQRF